MVHRRTILKDPEEIRNAIHHVYSTRPALLDAGFGEMGLTENWREAIKLAKGTDEEDILRRNVMAITDSV